MTTSGQRSTIVREVISSAANGADVMSALPGLVRQLLDEEAWREFAVAGLTKPVRHSTFTSFVRASPPRGLGGRSSQLIALCGAEQSTRERVERLLRGEIEPAAERRGRPTKSRGTRITTQESETADSTVARLKRDDPELAEKVVNGEISAYAAARSKGWKPPRIQVTTPERVAAHLRQHMKPDDITTLAHLLLEG